MYEMSLALSQSSRARKDKVVVLGTAVSFHAVVLATIVVASAWQIVPVGEPAWSEPFRLTPIIPVEFPRQEAKVATPRQIQAKTAAVQPATQIAPPATGAVPFTQPTTADLPIPTSPGLGVDTSGSARVGDRGVGGPGVAGEDGDRSSDVAIQFGRGMVAPQVLVRLEPVYPTIAIVARRQGTVVVEAEIDTQGTVRSVRVVSPRLGFGLEEAAETAVRAWRFSPARLGARPLAVYFRLTVQFRLR